MGTRDAYKPGTFSWVELSTTDPGAAKSFYGDLFGWEPRDSEMPGGGGTYTMAVVRDRAVAGITAQPEQQREAGVPPNWFSYVAVASADESSERARELGGSVHAGPFDVGDAGRMAVVADPTGAMFGVWEAREAIGAGRVNEDGCLTWNELATRDAGAASAFYSALFGWKIDEIDTGGGPRYWVIGHEGGADGQNGGMRELNPHEESFPPYWVPYFGTASVDESVVEVEKLGGGALMPPMDVPAGRFAPVRDPQGAIFCLFQGGYDD